MKAIAFFLLSCFLFSSCSTSYFYSMVNSNSPYVERDSSLSFVTNTDSVRITHSFSGEDSPVLITVENTMTQNLYVDWNKSYLMLDNDSMQAFPYVDYLAGFPSLELVPPHSKISRKFQVFSGFQFDKLKTGFIKKKLATPTGNSYVVNYKDYTESDSPLFFTSGLSVYLGNDLPKLPTEFVQDFYVSRLIKAGGTEPIVFLGDENRLGNMFYTRKEHGRGFWEGVGGVALVTVGIAAAVVLDPQEEY